MRKWTVYFIIIFSLVLFRENFMLAFDYEYIKDEKDRKEIKEELKNLKNSVNLVVFTSKDIDCRYCELTKQIIMELTSLSDKIKPKYYDVHKDKSMVKKYKVDRTPAVLIINKTDSNIRFFGMPGGYEFSSLVETLKNVSYGQSSLSQKNIDKLRNIKQPITIQVYVTPTCPYCPMAVIVANKIALVNPFITAETIEAQEFSELSTKNNVSAVPKIVIFNNKGKKEEFTGAYPEDKFVEKVLLVK